MEAGGGEGRVKPTIALSEDTGAGPDPPPDAFHTPGADPDLD